MLDTNRDTGRRPAGCDACARERGDAVGARRVLVGHLLVDRSSLREEVRIREGNGLPVSTVEVLHPSANREYIIGLDRPVHTSVNCVGVTLASRQCDARLRKGGVHKHILKLIGRAEPPIDELVGNNALGLRKWSPKQRRKTNKAGKFQKAVVLVRVRGCQTQRSSLVLDKERVVAAFTEITGHISKRKFSPRGESAKGRTHIFHGVVELEEVGDFIEVTLVKRENVANEQRRLIIGQNVIHEAGLVTERQRAIGV